MLNRILLAIALALISFQVFFSVYYSSQIVSHNQKYSELQKKYTELKYENQNLEIKFAAQNAYSR